MRRMTIIAVSVTLSIVGVTAGQAGGNRTEPTAVASVYAAAGGPLGCGGVGRSSELIVAHRTLPCGTRVRFCYPPAPAVHRSCVVATVRDRGPYIAGRTWDLAMATARSLGFPVSVEPVGYHILR